MSSAAVGTHSGMGSLSLMSCVRESSPLQDFEHHHHQDHEKAVVSSKKRFWNPKKWFRRKKTEQDIVPVEIHIENKDAARSRSTSEISVGEDQTRRSGSSMHPGLSVSHDSVFHSPNSESDVELEVAKSSSSLSISQPQIDLRLQTELSERLRLRRGRGNGDTSEDDEGLPHSPCNSPTATDALDKTGIKDLPTKSHSTCSDGSLLSMGSSDIEDDSINQQSYHSSKVSLHEKDSALDLSSNSSASPLNHSAAHHRVAVRPNKRRAPLRNKRAPQITTALPITLEVNEEFSMRSATEENISSTVIENDWEMVSSTSSRTEMMEIQMKCSSLPPGLALQENDNQKINRSQSNVGSKSQEMVGSEEGEDNHDDKSDKSFFDRIFPRRSGKKRKSKEEPAVTTKPPVITKTESKPMAVPRTGAASRQRIEPIDLPPSPGMPRKEGSSPPKMGGTSPLHMELENRFKQHKGMTGLSHSTPPRSPKSPKLSSDEVTVISRLEETTQHFRETRHQEFHTKLNFPGLSSLQQKVLTLRDEPDVPFSSLGDISRDADLKIPKPVSKSHSFKSTTHEEVYVDNNNTPRETELLQYEELPKAASLDSVKNLEPEIKDTTSRISEMFGDNVTISGPRHTAVVNVSSSNQNSSREVTKESVSITKIQLKREFVNTTKSTVTVPKSEVPEFLNKQLSHVDKSPSNVVLNTSNPLQAMNNIANIKPVVEQDVTLMRKFSKDNVEIIEKSDNYIVTTVANTPRFRKNEKTRKSSVESPRNREYSRSCSSDSLKTDTDISDRSSQDSLDRLEEKCDSKKSTPESGVVVMRKKSLVKQKNDEEPELMKVFARRSLKLKDSEADSVSDAILGSLADSNDKVRESDKENEALDVAEKENVKEIAVPEVMSNREPLVEAKVVDVIKTSSLTTATKDNCSLNEENNKKSESEVTLRKSVNNNFYAYQRAVTVNCATMKAVEEVSRINKRQHFNERRKTDNNWISSNIRNNKDEEAKGSQDELIADVPENKTPEIINITETKNFNQRKAEWEKRAQQAQKKSSP